MKRISWLAVLTLLSLATNSIAISGCGGSNEATVIKPEGTAEEIQAKADAKSDETDPDLGT